MAPTGTSSLPSIGEFEPSRRQDSSHLHNPKPPESEPTLLLPLPGVQTVKMGEEWAKMGKQWVKKRNYGPSEDGPDACFGGLGRHLSVFTAPGGIRGAHGQIEGAGLQERKRRRRAGCGPLPQRGGTR